MKLNLRAGGHGQMIIFKCRFFTLHLYWHRLKDWRRHK